MISASSVPASELGTDSLNVLSCPCTDMVVSSCRTDREGDRQGVLQRGV